MRWLTLFADLPAARFDRGIGFWPGVTGWRLGDPAGLEYCVTDHEPKGQLRAAIACW